MTKYVISSFTHQTGIEQQIIKADSKLEALIEYFDNECTDTNGNKYLDEEHVASDNGMTLDWDISIIRVGKKSKELEEDPDEGTTPWPWPNTYPE